MNYSAPVAGYSEAYKAIEREAHKLAWNIYATGQSLKSKGPSANPAIAAMPATQKSIVLQCLRDWATAKPYVDMAELAQLNAMRQNAMANGK